LGSVRSQTNVGPHNDSSETWQTGRVTRRRPSLRKEKKISGSTPSGPKE